MIEEQGRVVAVEPGAVWVETRRRSTCSSCSAQAACGQGLMDRLGVGERRGFVRAFCDLKLAVGDAVVIGIREDMLVRSALLVYLFPLLGLFGGGLAASAAQLSEPLVILGSLGGFALAWLGVRLRHRRNADCASSQPVVLRAVLATHS